jgi:hypothetical protein
MHWHHRRRTYTAAQRSAGFWLALGFAVVVVAFAFASAG